MHGLGWHDTREQSHPFAQGARGDRFDLREQEGSSALQIQRALEITYRSPWFMCRRIREAIGAGGVSRIVDSEKIVVCEEWFVGSNENHEHNKKRGLVRKIPVVSLV